MPPQPSLEQHDEERGKYIGDTVFGALDGIVTTFAVISGVTGASLSSSIILILGFANLVADGISMAAGNYLGTKSEQDYIRREREREIWEVDNLPEVERKEIADIYRKKGFTGKALDLVVKTLTRDKKIWVDTMMLEELRLVEEKKNPLKAAAVTFSAFAVAGFIPLASYVLALAFPALGPHSFPLSILLATIALFLVGALRTLVIKKNPIKAGLEMLAVGGLAALGAYGVGYLASIFLV